MAMDITVDGGGDLLRTNTRLLYRHVRKRLRVLSFELIGLARPKILDGTKHDFLPTVGTEQTAMNSLVPFRPVPQGRTELRHAPFSDRCITRACAPGTR